MQRRGFLRQAGMLAGLAATRRICAQDDTLRGSLSIDWTSRLATLPADFMGLSYESAQLANPAFFAPSNKPLIALVRELGVTGVLRIGGGSSEFTTYAAVQPAELPPFETFGPDTSHTVKSGTTTSALALRNLRGFLDATGWTCLYGLNLGQGTVDNAVAEALAVTRILGPRLLALQLGNEPDSFRNRYRPASYTPADFLVEWNRFHDAIVSALAAAGMAAHFAGPDISNKLAFLTAFAAEAPRHRDVLFLTGHDYAMGPAGNPEATLANMLLPDPKLTTLKARDIPVVQEAAHTAHLPFRVSEMNSCWNGGQTGASDTFASALWCADTLLRFASLGFSGVNLHGGGNGIYSPIVGAPSSGFSRRPEFFGMLFAQKFVQATLLRCRIEIADARVTAYVAERKGSRQLAIINKTSAPVSCALPSAGVSEGWLAKPTFELAAPAIDATSGVQLRPLKVSAASGTLSVPPYSARLFELSPAFGAGRGPHPAR